MAALEKCLPCIATHFERLIVVNFVVMSCISKGIAYLIWKGFNEQTRGKRPYSMEEILYLPVLREVSQS